MSCLFLLLRPVLFVLFGLVVWAGLLMYLASGIISNKLLDPDSYIETLRQADAYNRIYSEILVDPALQDDLRESFRRP